jgi:hypothetical protein
VASFSQRWLRVVLALTTAAICASMVAAEASQRRPPERWPGSAMKVRVSNARWQSAARQAVMRLNSTGVAIRLELTTDPATADVTLREMPRRRFDKLCRPEILDGPHRKVICSAIASNIGFRGRPEHVTFAADAMNAADGISQETLLVEHELLHVLGVVHQPGRCALMNKDTGTRRCGTGPPFYERCGPMPLDIEQLTGLYGRASVRYSPYCPRESSVGSMEPLVLTASGRWVKSHLSVGLAALQAPH